MRNFLAVLFLTRAAWAEGERAGDFNYYVLSLSWSPSWCALEGDARSSTQCDGSNDFGWVLHGLWPQNDQGWPSYCRTTQRDPSRSQTGAMADIMGSSGAGWYQWKKHGRCSGSSAVDYFAAARQAYAAVDRPEVFRNLTRAITLPADLVEEAFLQSNPDLGPDMITITCKSHRIQEARICLNKDLSLRKCGDDVARECRLNDALLDQIR
jgi:ribonuclease T2